MLSYCSDTGWVFDPFQCCFVVSFIAFQVYRSYTRKRSLYQKDDGVFVRIEWHSRRHSSSTDPSMPGGAWDNKGDGDGGGD